MARVLVIDDSPMLLELTVRGLAGACYEAAGAADLAQLDQQLATGPLDLILVDVNMPGVSGLDLHRRLVASGLRIPTILITAYPNDRVRAGAVRDGVLCLLAKPHPAGRLTALRCG